MEQEIPATCRRLFWAKAPFRINRNLGGYKGPGVTVTHALGRQPRARGWTLGLHAHSPTPPRPVWRGPWWPGVAAQTTRKGWWTPRTRSSRGGGRGTGWLLRGAARSTRRRPTSCTSSTSSWSRPMRGCGERSRGCSKRSRPGARSWPSTKSPASWAAATFFWTCWRPPHPDPGPSRGWSWTSPDP